MISILGFFFLLIIIVLIFGLSIIRGILKFLFGFGHKSASRNQEKESQEDFNHTTSNHNRKKIFEEGEGEYVDFEEVKEEKK